MKRFLSLLLTVALLLSITPMGLFAITANAQNNSTKTVVSDEFIHLTEVPTGYVGIYTKSDLDAIRNNLSGNYILMNDVNFSADDFWEAGQFYNNGKGWNSIGNSESPFTGTFDGNGYCVNGLSISGSITESPYVGLFGYNKGCIKNITLIGQITITHASNTAYVGMIAGYSEGTIENCKSVGDISVESTILRATYETPYSYVGGITGCSVGTLSLCENTCDIQATPSVIAYAEAAAYLGGVAGVANSSTISNCINSGTITLTPTLDANTGITVYAGGISGQSNSNTTGCDNSGSVVIEEFKASSTSSVAIEAKFYVAGIIGYSTGTITGSNNAGMIRARGVYAYSGGIAGYNTGTLSQCSNIGNIMAITTSTGSATYSYGYSGGIAGYSTGTTSESYNTGFVEVNEAGASEAAYSGGIVSYQKGGTIINCYNAGYVPDKTYYGHTGGIAGVSTGSISLCYNIGRVPEGYPCGSGAIVGNTSQITPNCFFLDDNKVGVAKGKDSTISCSKEALLLAETYTGFDFNSVWEIGIYDTYPCATLKNVDHKSSIIGNDLFAGGTGTVYDPFLIENAEQLNNVRTIPSAYYALIADITFTDSDYAENGAFYNDGEGWLPIMYFVGSFDGRGHVVSNLQIYHAPTSSTSSYSSSDPKYARYYDDCFGLFGYNCGGTISRVGVTGNIYVKKFDRPSLLDYAYVGGIAGESNGTISECYFIGSVYGTAPYSSSVAGICGWSWTPKGTLENCFSVGTFRDGIAGGNSGYKNCYSIKNGNGTITGTSGSKECTNEEMQTQSTYIDFDFDSVWTMEGDVHYLYPELQSVKLDPSLINHTFTKEDTTYLKSEATCTSPAIYYKSCSACGEKGEETFEYGLPKEHSFTREVISDTYKKADATCTEAAIYNYCCATCDAKGTNTYKVGSANGHTNATAVVENKVDANCTVDGSYDSVVYCSVCDAELSREAKTIDKLGHNYETKWTTDLEPTCTTVGSKSHHCTRCGDKVEVTEVAKLVHDYKTVFTWSEDHTSCTVVITCARGCGLSETANCTVTHSESNQAQTLHTAVAEYDGERFTDILTCGNFLITFKDWDDTEISSTYYHIGDTVTAPTNPTKAADKTYTYTFAGWDKEVTKCVGDAIYTATYTKQPITFHKVHQWNITLEEDFKINFYLAISDDIVGKAKIRIMVGEEMLTYQASKLEKNAEGYYVLTVAVSAAQMNDAIVVMIMNGNTVAFTETYTIRQYCDVILTNQDYSAYHTLVKAMLHYGAMAQVYFDYDAENLANDGIVDIANADVPGIVEEIVISNNISGLNFYGASLVFRDRIAVRYYFTGDVTGCTFTANSNTYTPVAKDGMSYVEIPDILPQNLDQQITLTVTDAGGKTLTVTYGPMNYIVRMNEKGSAALQNLVKALYNYHLAAKALQEIA